MSYTNYTCIIIVINDTRRISCVRVDEEPISKKIWETWYFWLGVGLVFVLFVASATSYLASSCKSKQQNLIRIRNAGNLQGGGVVIATTSGPGGIIQPEIHHFNNVVGVLPIYDSDLPVASPLNPPYPPVEPITIVRGSAPPQGYRQTNSYTEIALPPGYVDLQTRQDKQ